MNYLKDINMDYYVLFLKKDLRWVADFEHGLHTTPLIREAHVSRGEQEAEFYAEEIKEKYGVTVEPRVLA